MEPHLMKAARSGCNRNYSEGDEKDVTVWDVDGAHKYAIPVVRFGGRGDSSLFKLMRIVAMIDSIWIPFLLSFGQLDVVGTAIRTPHVFVCDSFVNSIYAFGVIVQLWTSYVILATGQELVHPWQIVKYRFTSPTFWADLLSCIGACWWLRGCYFFAIFRILRIWRLSPSADDLYELHHAELSSGSAAKQLCSLLFFTCLVMHLFACAWFYTATLTEDWEYLLKLQLRYDTIGVTEVLKLYARHTMDGATMLAGWGGPSSKDEGGKITLPETIAWCILAPLAALVNGLVFVELIEITKQMGAATEKHLDKLAELGSVLESLQAPKSLVQRCMKYHCFLSIHNANRKEYEDMFDALSQRLQDDIKVHLFDKLVRHAHFFDLLPPDLIESLVISCEEEVYGPGQTIMHQGEIGSDLYFVMKGCAYVFVSDVCVATKEVGDYFGEVGLIYDAPRSATLCAKSFTILARLTRASYVQVLQEATQECREQVTRCILDGCKYCPTPNPDRDDTPLLSAERETSMEWEKVSASGVGISAKRVSQAWEKVSAMGSCPTTPGLDSYATNSEASIKNLEQRIDRLTLLVQDGFARLQQQIEQFSPAASANRTPLRVGTR